MRHLALNAVVAQLTLHVVDVFTFSWIMGSVIVRKLSRGYSCVLRAALPCLHVLASVVQSEMGAHCASLYCGLIVSL